MRGFLIECRSNEKALSTGNGSIRRERRHRMRREYPTVIPAFGRERWRRKRGYMRHGKSRTTTLIENGILLTEIHYIKPTNTHPSASISLIAPPNNIEHIQTCSADVYGQGKRKRGLYRRRVVGLAGWRLPPGVFNVQRGEGRDDDGGG
jgi:hypothetical protein